MSDIAWAVVWVVFAAVAWLIAARKGRAGFVYFVTSVCLTLLVGITAAIIAKSRKDSRNAKTV